MHYRSFFFNIWVLFICVCAKIALGENIINTIGEVRQLTARKWMENKNYKLNKTFISQILVSPKL